MRSIQSRRGVRGYDELPGALSRPQQQGTRVNAFASEVK